MFRCLYCSFFFRGDFSEHVAYISNISTLRLVTCEQSREQRKEIFNDAWNSRKRTFLCTKIYNFAVCIDIMFPCHHIAGWTCFAAKKLFDYFEMLCMLARIAEKQQQRWPKKGKKEFITHLQHRQRKYLEYLINIRRQAVEFHTRENEQFIVQLEIIAACPLHEAYVSEERKPLVFSYQNHEVIQLIYSLDMDSWRKQSREREGRRRKWSWEMRTG